MILIWNIKLVPQKAEQSNDEAGSRVIIQPEGVRAQTTSTCTPITPFIPRPRNFLYPFKPCLSENTKYWVDL